MSIHMTRAEGGGQTYINGYGDGGFRIGGMRHEGSVLIVGGRVIPWDVTDPAAITVESLGAMAASAAEIDILVIGTGRDIRFPAELRLALEQAGLPADAMSTGAAARTYNVLLLEGRRVAAALIAVA